jgi:hypothetical protein
VLTIDAGFVEINAGEYKFLGLGFVHITMLCIVALKGNFACEVFPLLETSQSIWGYAPGAFVEYAAYISLHAFSSITNSADGFYDLAIGLERLRGDGFPDATRAIRSAYLHLTVLPKRIGSGRFPTLTWRSSVDREIPRAVQTS